MNRSLGVIYLLTFSLFTGLTGYIVKLTHGLDPGQILFCRAVFASFFLFCIAVYTKKLKQLKLRHPLLTFTMAVVQGLSIYLFYTALGKTTLANAMFLTYTAPIFSAVLAVIFLKEKLALRTIFGIVTSLLGVLLIANPTQLNLGTGQAQGSLLALGGAFFYAAMAISSKSLTQKTTPLYSAFWQYFIIMLLTSIFATHLTFPQVTANLIPLLYLGWIAGGIAFLLFMKGVSLVKGQIIQVVTMTEVLVGTLAGTFLLGEPLTFPNVIGGTCILLGVLIISINKTKVTK